MTQLMAGTYIKEPLHDFCDYYCDGPYIPTIRNVELEFWYSDSKIYSITDTFELTHACFMSVFGNFNFPINKMNLLYNKLRVGLTRPAKNLRRSSWKFCLSLSGRGERSQLPALALSANLVMNFSSPVSMSFMYVIKGTSLRSVPRLSHRVSGERASLRPPFAVCCLASLRSICEHYLVIYIYFFLLSEMMCGVELYKIS